ncbi:glycoside hydrolase family 18 protein [Amylocarpus encephaloides]|uniref:Glycoside hydrolase family 18 protein n=1 Tax=Amylocarpus encephaloides TaxID=45428 RepID=A0A9P7YC95_9HELO|nr:glycoside hydrolase family 18 protein [Amylocarpus encephaloides]
MSLFFIIWLLAFLNQCFAWHSEYPLEHVGHHNLGSALKEPARLVMYVQTFQTPDGHQLSLLPLLQHHTRVTHVVLAALHLHDLPGEIRLNDDRLQWPMWDNLWSDVKELQANGVKVMALLGGAAGGTYKHFNGTEAKFYAYYNPLLTIIRERNLDGLDLDIEEHVDIKTPIRLMTALRRDLGPDFIITMSPLASALSDRMGQNLSGFSYFDLDEFATEPGSDAKLVNWYNGLFYGGFARGPPFYRSCVEAGWDPSRIVMVVLDCMEDGQPNGWVDLPRLEKTIWGLRGMYKHFGGIGGWEYHDAGNSDWDEYQPWNWVKQVGQAIFDPVPKHAVNDEL